MKIFSIIPLLLFSATFLNAQKVRLEGDNSKYLCLNDSITETFLMELSKNKIDSTIVILYDYDNGRLANSIGVVMWTHNGVSKLRLVEGCHSINKDTTFTCNLVDLRQYIGATYFSDISVPIRSGTGQSHDKFYHITVTAPARSFFIVVRDNERQSTEKHKTPESDTRVMLTNKIDALVK